ncbi:MAG: type III-A CRISPR-associated protein Cas10/Csm1 [Elusimicrobiota bacterium]|jgi:CRISPR-associated protein Csm1|nr:type III-A CRISPR-associated protein Cas10/Csm1 [Elusimicrobiota bacterium]
MKDNAVLVIALAGFLHDIGKFAQRAKADGYSDIEPNEKFYEKQELYQPKRDNKFTHIHALYSAYFIDKLLEAKLIPEIKDKDYFINLAARHHISNNSFEEKIITVADRLSAGMDRKDFDNKNNPISYIEWIDTRLMNIFDEIDCKIADYSQRRFEHGLSIFDKDGIFPKSKETGGQDYSMLFKDFFKELNSLPKDNLENWFISFDKLNQKYTSFVPSATVKSVIPDISLYDHAKTTSAIAQSLYVWHRANNDDKYKSHINDNEDIKKFLYAKIKFNGIQNFIFSQGGETNKNAAKILRGRSFYISLLIEYVSRLLCDNLGLAMTAIIMNAAGSITAILPNTNEIKEKINDTEKLINNWFIKQFYGEVSVSFAHIEISSKDLTDNLKEIGVNIAKELEKKKFKKFDIEKLGVVKDYFKENETVCLFCGKRPAKDNDDRDKIKCLLCQDLTDIGKNLASNVSNYKLNAPIFDKYDVIDFTEFYNENNPKPYVARDEQENKVKDFEAIANGDGAGIKALAVLKADVDNLGNLFNQVSSSGGLSKQATFSRMLNAFWTIYLPSLLKDKFSDVYTVFAGGDDLFLIGKWDAIIDLAIRLKDDFAQYVCGNVNFSAGIALLKDGEPIKRFYKLSEDALECSKRNEGKNSLTLFGETIKWAEYIREDKDEISKLLSEDKINNAGLQKLLSLIDMANKADEISAGKRNADIKEMQNFKWKALLTYFIARNEKVKEQMDKQNLINNFVKQIGDLSKRKTLKISLWKNIYKNRTRGQ